MARANSEFDVLITMDVGFAERHDLADRRIAVILLRARSNRLADTRPLMPNVMSKVENIQSGTVTVIS